MAAEVGSNADQKKTEPTLQSSIKTLKAKFVPKLGLPLLITAAFNFSMLIVGCLNVHRCYVSKNIPLYLIATGAIGLLSKFTSYMQNRIVIPKSIKSKVVYFEVSFYSVEGIFFFLGSYWVYKEYKPSYDPVDGPDYCNKTAYLFAFIYLTVIWSVILLVFLVCCCLFCCIIASDSEDSTEGGDIELQAADDEATKISNIKQEEAGKL